MKNIIEYKWLDIAILSLLLSSSLFDFLVN